MIRNLTWQHVITTCGLCLLIGCDNKPNVRPNWAIVSGIVTFKGKPLEHGYIAFYPAADLSTNSSGRINQGGTFTLEAPVGGSKVTVENGAPRVGSASPAIHVPEIYADPVKSGLAYEVKAGENKDVKFDLK